MCTPIPPHARRLLLAYAFTLVSFGVSRAQAFALDHATALATYDSLLCDALSGTVTYEMEAVGGGPAPVGAAGEQQFYYEAGVRYAARHSGGLVVQEGRTRVSVNLEIGRLVVDTLVQALEPPGMAIPAELSGVFADRAEPVASRGPGERRYHVDLGGHGGYARAYVTFDVARGYFDEIRLEYDRPQGAVAAVKMRINLGREPVPSDLRLAVLLAEGGPGGGYADFDIYGL